MRSLCFTIMLASSLAACGDGKGKPYDAAPELPDAAPMPPDAAPLPPDAAPLPAKPTAARELVPAAGTMHGGSFTADVQVGHPTSQETTAGDGVTFEGNAVVKP